MSPWAKETPYTYSMKKTIFLINSPNKHMVSGFFISSIPHASNFRRDLTLNSEKNRKTVVDSRNERIFPVN
jgi:hypothetical protein